MKTKNFKCGDKAYIALDYIIVECIIKDICTDLQYQKKLDDESISEYLGYKFSGKNKKASIKYPDKNNDDYYFISYKDKNQNLREEWVREDILKRNPKNFLNIINL